MKLYGSVRSPYVIKVRVAIAEKNIACDYEEVAASAAVIAAVNPLAKIPTLVRDDNTGLYDSSVIIEYIDGLSDTPKLIPANFHDRIEVRRWEALGDGIMDALVAIMHDKRLPPAQQRGSAYIDRHHSKVTAGLAAMNQALAIQPFCHGASLTLADIACGCALRYLGQVLPDENWRPHNPALAAHQQRLSERPSFKALT